MIITLHALTYNTNITMTIKQISIFLENKSGRLADVLGCLGHANIKICALTIADTSEYGILRMIVSDSAKAVEVLQANEFTVNITDVIALATANQAGSFAKILRMLADEGLSIEYMYAFKWSKGAAMILRTNEIAQTLKTFEKNSIKLLSHNDIANL